MNNQAEIIESLQANLAAVDGLSDVISKRLTKDIAVAVVSTILDLASKDGVRVPDLGTFKYYTRAAYTARNPRTGEAVPVDAKTKLVFKAIKSSK